MSIHQLTILPDPEALAQLARENPQAFEALRSELIEDCISSAPELFQTRLRGIQFRVDCVRRLAHSPLGALIKIQSMMWESFLQMDQELQHFAQQPTVPRRVSIKRLEGNHQPEQSAVIIEFQRTEKPG